MARIRKSVECGSRVAFLANTNIGVPVKPRPHARPPLLSIGLIETRSPARISMLLPLEEPLRLGDRLPIGRAISQRNGAACSSISARSCQSIAEAA